ncbi:MAG: GNAT family N-acetyltransferase [Novosphingobium sp.]|nr:GNAT family N-acetyltransferase [Novosphingobium sp.]
MTVPRDDIDRIMEVMEAAFDPLYREAWTRKQVESAMIVGNCHYILVGEDGGPPLPDRPAAGFSLSRSMVDEEELLLFAVNPEFRRRGLGGIMLAELANAAADRGARRIFLEMRRGNPAEKLYSQFGFVPVGERPNYYRLQTGERIDAITFARDIG